MSWFSWFMEGFTRRVPRQRTTTDPRTTEKLAELERLRATLEAAFSPETAAPGTDTTGRPPSAGQCAAVSMIVWDRFGGEFVSVSVQGQSHWFNRLNIGGRVMDVDLTGDQFGLQAVRFGEPGSLWANARPRSPHELREETVRRAILLAEKAGLKDTEIRLQSLLDSAAWKAGSSGVHKSARER